MEKSMSQGLTTKGRRYEDYISLILNMHLGINKKHNNTEC